MRYRTSLLISIAVLIPVGYAVRFSGIGPEWLNDALGSVLYEMVWIALVAYLMPRAQPHWIALGVCLLTFGIEFLQLWRSPFWLAVRATLPGRLILGNTFSWADFPAYMVGCGVGWLGLRSLHRTEDSPKLD